MIIIVKCVNCGAKKEIEANELRPDDVPICDKCFMPMVAEKAKVKNKKET